MAASGWVDSPPVAGWWAAAVKYVLVPAQVYVATEIRRADVQPVQWLRELGVGLGAITSPMTLALPSSLWPLGPLGMPRGSTPFPADCPNSDRVREEQRN